MPARSNRHRDLVVPRPPSSTSISNFTRPTNLPLLPITNPTRSRMTLCQSEYHRPARSIARTWSASMTHLLDVVARRAGRWRQVLTVAATMGLQRIYVIGSLQRPLELAVDPDCIEKP